MSKFNKPATTAPVQSEEVTEALSAYHAKYGVECPLSPSLIQEMFDEEAEPVDIDDFVLKMHEAANATDEDDEAGENDDRTTDTGKPKSVAVSKRNQDAVAFGLIIQANAAIVADLREAQDIEVKRKRGPANTAWNMMNDKAITQDIILGMPRPGSRKDSDDIKGTNKPFDVRQAGNGELPGSFYGDIYDVTDDGKELLKTLEELRLAKKGDSAAPAKYSGKGEEWLVAEINLKTTERVAAIKRIKTAVNVLKRFHEVKDRFGFLCTVRHDTDKAGKKTLIRSTAPISVGYAKEQGGERFLVTKYLGVSQFLNVDLDEVESTEGDTEAKFAAFKAKRAANADGDTDNVTIKNMAQFESAMPELQYSFEDSKFVAQLYVELLKNDGLLLSFGKAATEMERMLAKPTVAAKYAALAEAEANKGKKAAA